MLHFMCKYFFAIMPDNAVSIRTYGVVGHSHSCYSFHLFVYAYLLFWVDIVEHLLDSFETE